MKSLLIFLLLLLPAAAAAREPDPTTADPVTAARAVKIAKQLRCLVCQNQSIAESNADLAVDLRRQIFEQIIAGRSDAAIVDFMVERYGDFVRYRPPFKPSTALLWFGPALLLALGAWLLGRVLRAPPAAPPPLTADDHARAERLLRGDADTGMR